MDPIATRYAQALFESAQAEGRMDETLEQLTVLGGLIRREPQLRQLLWNPDVDAEDKVGVLDRTLQQSWSELVRAFVRMVTSMGRAEFLPQMAEAFEALVDEAQGRMRVLVRSARPLSAPVLERLRARLSRQEGHTIELSTESAPELLGGVQIRLDHRVIDGSVQRQLVDLRQRLKSVKVN